MKSQFQTAFDITPPRAQDGGRMTQNRRSDLSIAAAMSLATVTQKKNARFLHGAGQFAPSTYYLVQLLTLIRGETNQMSLLHT